ncbi:MAG TPA: hypothetical protein VII69_14665 [Candidatus Eremiobacteraceae bacterium]
MTRFKMAAAVLAAASLVCLAACGGHAGGSDLSILPQLPISALQTRPGPAPMQTFAPNAFLANTSEGIHALQVFDQAHGYTITSAESVADGGRYASVWGVRSPHMASSWHTNNERLNALIYTPYDTDATGSGLDRPRSWWLANHPDWILYECDRTTIAYVRGLRGVPLDISNQAVWQYQVALLGSYAEANSFDGLAADIVSLKNNTGDAEFGHGGCGVWIDAHTTWVAKFSGSAADPLWAAATQKWVAGVHQALHDSAEFPRTLALAVNTNVDSYVPPGKFPGGEPGEQAIVNNADIIMNEAGFAMWGKFVGDRGFNNAFGWMEYAQSIGKAMLITDDWDHQSQAPTIAQLDYSIATYLMGKEQAAALYVGQNGMYGKENYYPEYDAKIGQACAAMYGGPDDPWYRGENIYFRKYSGGMAIVNVNDSLPYSVVLPKKSYRDIEGRTITSPLTLQPNSGVVLMTSDGCK